ncbi:MAG: FkbM family methyltransferase [Bacteroidia bacterium]|nr:FkbM family methyltransferase [Bacteroidia bacterium]
MIYPRIIFPIKQRLFWKGVRKRLKSWDKIVEEKESTKIITTDNIRFNLYKDDVLSKLIYAENFEWAEKEWLKSFLKPGMICYDLGANIGFYTLLSAYLTFPNGKIVSLEPVSKTFDRLKANIDINDKISNCVSCYKIAASNSAGELEIFTASKDLHAWNSLVAPQNKDEFIKEIIKTISLDSLFENENLPVPDFIKIDVEGWEENVLIGAKHILTKFSPTLLIEFTKDNLLRAGTSYQKLINILSDYGYNLYEYLPRYKKLVLVDDWNFEHKNIIAIKKL